MKVEKEAYRIKQNGAWHTIIDNPKTKSSIRVIPLPKTLLAKLKEIKKKSKNEHILSTRAVELGIDVKSLAEIMGHKNPTVTLQRYTHSLLSYKTDMMNKLGKMLAV